MKKGVTQMNGRRSRLFGVTLLLILVLMLTGCDFLKGMATERVRRDLDTTGADGQAFCLSGGTQQESQGVQIVGPAGADIASLVYERSAGSRTERIMRFNPSTRLDEVFWRSTQYETSEDIFGIRGASYIIQRFFRDDGPDLVVLKSEMKFSFSLALNKLNDQDFELASLYYLEVPAGEKLTGAEMVSRAKPWYTKLVYNTVFDKRWSPYCVAIRNTRLERELPANWAQVNEYFDEALLMARDLVDDLERHNWQGLSSDLGEIYKIIGNPTELRDIVGFESTFPGWAVGDAGIRYNYRFVPQYNVLHLDNADYGWGKQNSRNESLQALVLEIEEEGRYIPRAVFFFVKSRWAKNGLYALERLEPGESPAAVVNRAFSIINTEIPEDIIAAYERGETDKVAHWSATLPPFNLEQIGTDFAAIVEVVDVTETLSGKTTEGEEKVEVEVKGPRAMKGTYHYYGDLRAVDYFLALLGEHAVEFLDLGYIQPEGGDGVGFVMGLVEMVTRFNKGTVTFDDTARPDQRAPESPEMVTAALKYFTGTE